ncbi:MAG TPA: ABC transporter permease [Gaiellaceae bacterium]|jgi:putative ABC transport system permease protein
MSAHALPPSRLLAADVVSVGSMGLRTRRLRAALSALGIAIGIASMVAVLAISDSSKAGLIATLDRLGTNLLTLAPGQSFFGDEATLPLSAPSMLRRLAAVEQVASVESVDAATVRRSPYVPKEQTSGVGVTAADPGLLRTLGGSLADGTFLNAATARRPVVVLGADAARALGITRARPGTLVYLGGEWFAVAGILEPLTLAPELDRAALIGFAIAKRLFGTDGHPSTVYLRADPDRLSDVRGVLGAQANPEHPEQVQVSRPSDALAARAAAKTAFTALFLGLGAVALLVGGVGIANVMVISVLERRSEIGLRRALGATQAHVRVQFLAESLALSAVGGAVGVVGGLGVSTAYASSRGWPVSLPPAVAAAGLGAALGIGAVAGLYPAMRAARLSPTEALRTV